MFSDDAQFWRAGMEASIALNMTPLATRMCEGLTKICPGWAPGWAERYTLWHRLGNEDEKARTLAEAEDFHGEQRQIDSLSSGFHLLNNRPDDAIERARRYSTKTLFKPDGAMLIVAIMNWAGRRDDAIRGACSCCRNDRIREETLLK